MKILLASCSRRVLCPIFVGTFIFSCVFAFFSQNLFSQTVHSLVGTNIYEKVVNDPLANPHGTVVKVEQDSDQDDWWDIQSAINLAARNASSAIGLNSGGHVIYLPAGEYVVDHPIILWGGQLVGDPNGGTVIRLKDNTYTGSLNKVVSSVDKHGVPQTVLLNSRDTDPGMLPVIAANGLNTYLRIRKTDDGEAWSEGIPDNLLDTGDGENYRDVFTGKWRGRSNRSLWDHSYNDNYRISIRDITINTGNSNPRACGLLWATAQGCYAENLNIFSEDGLAKVGIHTHGAAGVIQSATVSNFSICGVRKNAAALVFRDLTVRDCYYGVLAGGAVNRSIFVNLKVYDCKVALVNFGQATTIYGGVFEQASDQQSRLSDNFFVGDSMYAQDISIADESELEYVSDAPRTTSAGDERLLMRSSPTLYTRLSSQGLQTGELHNSEHPSGNVPVT